MSDNDSPTFPVNKIHMPSPKRAESALLTLERVQKLDLLVHLITNLRQSLVICGPHGIGKTTLLAEVKKCNQDAVPILDIQASSSTSFESFQSQLRTFLFEQFDFNSQAQNIPSILSILDQQNKTIVIIIDNAGDMVSGMANTLIQYANSNKCLRIIFALTHDELRVKNNSDRAIEECHFIDIPPLTKSQCGVFLRNLSTKAGSVISLEEVNDSLVDKIYNDTQGVPGKIISEISEIDSYSFLNMKNYKWFVLVVVAVILVIFVGFFMLDDSEVQQGEVNDKKVMSQDVQLGVIEQTSPKPINDSRKNNLNEDLHSINPTLKFDIRGKEIISGEDFFSQKDQREKESNQFLTQELNEIDKLSSDTQLDVTDKVKPEIINVVSESQLEQELPSNMSIKNSSLRTDDPIEEIFLPQNSDEAENSVKDKVKNNILSVKKIGKNETNTNKESDLKQKTDNLADKSKIFVKESKKKISNSKKKLKTDDSEWVLKQPEKNYTMQLIVLSKRESVSGFLKEYPNFLKNLKFFKKKNHNSYQYVVVYGSFKDAAAASKKMKSLPPRYRKAWIRSFSGLQKMIKK